MTSAPQLFSGRIAELTSLIEAHLERGSLDEGNATAFDSIIDAWLREEISRLDGALAVSADDDAAQRAAATAERQHRHARELSADARWREITDAHLSARKTADAARQTSNDERIRVTAERLDQARSELAAARELLLGPSTSPNAVLAPLEDPDGTDDNTVSDGDEWVA